MSVNKLNTATERTSPLGTDNLPIQDTAGTSWLRITLTGLYTVIRSWLLAAANTWTGVQTFSSTIQGNVSGSAATLATPRTIGGVAFDGSANINLPGVNQTGNQDTTGNAATVTDGVYASAANSFSQKQVFDSGSQNVPDYAGTLPDNSADSMGDVGDEYHFRDKIYRKTSTGWVVFTGSTF